MKRLFIISLTAVCALALGVLPASAADADGDGHDDVTELLNGYDPYGPGRPSEIDSDADGLPDYEERVYGSDPLRADSDSDGYADGLEVRNGFDPIKPESARLKKKIEISLAAQQLTYYAGPSPVARHPVSTGRKGWPTPKGTFAINSKSPRAWSASSRLWMPWWMAFKGGLYGIHELPEWPGGKKEGENRLGTPASHGCVRLGVGPAKNLYDWAEIGTEVVVKD